MLVGGRGQGYLPPTPSSEAWLCPIFTRSSVWDPCSRLMIIFHFFSSYKTHTFSWSSSRQEPVTLFWILQGCLVPAQLQRWEQRRHWEFLKAESWFRNIIHSGLVIYDALKVAGLKDVFLFTPSPPSVDLEIYLHPKLSLEIKVKGWLQCRQALGRFVSRHSPH